MQGFNMGRYYPPDASNSPSFNKSHPLGARANKISQGILTVRFELPFAVWCQHCKPEAIVGQGVRFNAAKKKVGNYYSTPIWSFNMRHTACSGEWEIRTDPKTTQYVCVEGCRKRDYGPDDSGAQDGEMKFLSEADKEKRREDAFAGLEGKLEEKARNKDHKERLEELYEKAEVWRDPYDVNAKLRQEMREKRKLWNRDEKHREGMQDKFSLHLDILDETDADRQTAQFIEYGVVQDKSEAWKPLFTEPQKKDADQRIMKPHPKKLKAEIAAEKSRKDLQKNLVSNTRAVVDPFASRETTSTTRPKLGLLKRKRDVEDVAPSGPQTLLPMPGSAQKAAVPAQGLAALIGYDSD